MRLSNGAVYCWGNAANGEIGDGTALTPTPPPPRLAPTTAVVTTGLGSATFVQLAAGAAAVCGRDSSGAVWCWGKGYMGVLGNNNQGDQPAPVQVMNLTGATQLDVGHRTACAIDGANQLFCWGNNRRSRMTNALPQGAVLTATKVPL
jgi:serine/threonine-protein kinase